MPAPWCVFNPGLRILPGIRIHSPSAHLRGSSKEMHPLNFMLVFPVYVAASHKRGRGQADIASIPRAVRAASSLKCKLKCQKARKESTVKPPPSCLASCTTMVCSPSTRERWSPLCRFHQSRPCSCTSECPQEYSNCLHSWTWWHGNNYGVREGLVGESLQFSYEFTVAT